MDYLRNYVSENFHSKFGSQTVFFLGSLMQGSDPLKSKTLLFLHITAELGPNPFFEAIKKCQYEWFNQSTKATSFCSSSIVFVKLRTPNVQSFNKSTVVIISVKKGIKAEQQQTWEKFKTFRGHISGTFKISAIWEF